MHARTQTLSPTPARMNWQHLQEIKVLCCTTLLFRYKKRHINMTDEVGAETKSL